MNVYMSIKLGQLKPNITYSAVTKTEDQMLRNISAIEPCDIADFSIF